MAKLGTAFIHSELENRMRAADSQISRWLDVWVLDDVGGNIEGGGERDVFRYGELEGLLDIVVDILEAGDAMGDDEIGEYLRDSILLNCSSWRRIVEVLGPRSCCTASLFIPTAMQRWRRQPRH